MTQDSAQHQKMEDCRRACLHASASCLQVLRALAHENRIGVETTTLLSLQLAAEVAQLSAKSLALGLDVHGSLCRACAELCLRSAENCEGWGSGDLYRNCADLCRQCAEACRELTTDSRGHLPVVTAAFAAH